ncbi:decaprenyl-phosphate phosphoribosyltransferase [Patescibacteria group bacterium]|nr:decaprenyl-phosphate phosphoribosyltransferase [Patescibacteria group bacterium]
MRKRITKNLITDIFISLRPFQWLKNLIVFAAIIFSQELFITDKFIPVFYTFIIFSASSSAMYLINDLVDRPRDQIHFLKKLRPISAGKLSPSLVLFLAAALVVFSLLGSYFLSGYLLFIILIYLAVQLFYNFWLKNVIILDVLAIAFAFMLRIFAGSVVVLTPLSAWLILTTMMLALFLGIGKRRSELTIMGGDKAIKHRTTLLSYPPQLLDGLSFMMATAALITYSLFTFNSPEFAQKEFFAVYLPRTLSSPKLLMITIPIVAYGIFRYLYLIFEKSEGDTPERVLVSDRPLLASVTIWIATVIVLLYFFAI